MSMLNFACPPEAGAPRMTQGIRQQQKDQTRREILSAAKELFLDLGYDHATTRRIAEAAGVGTGTVFAHFADKNEIVRALLLQDVDDILAAAKSEVAEGTGAVDALLLYAERLYAYYRGQWELSRVLLGNLLFNAQDYQAQVAAFAEELALRLAVDAPEMTPSDRAVLAQCLFANYMMTLICGLGIADSSLESWMDQLERGCRLVVRPFAGVR
jgi:AcrR family transcriptional regulator